MSDGRDAQLERIAQALESLAATGSKRPDWLDAPAYVWDGMEARAQTSLDAPELALLQGIDAQKQAVTANVARLAAGHAAHDMLLWGSRGMGKSALVRAAIVGAQADDPSRIALVQVAPDAVTGLPALFAQLAALDRSFLLFLDDLGFADDDATGPRHVRSWLDGGVEARPGNVRLAVTSNRRAIVTRSMAEQEDPLNPRDAVDDKLALADRFGLSLGFHNCDQPTYLAIIAGYADKHGLEWCESEALEWARQRGARSGRTAWQFVTELAGRAGKPL